MGGHVGATLSAWREVASALEVPQEESVAEQKKVVLERIGILMSVLRTINPLPYELYYSPVLDDYLCWLEGWHREDSDRETLTVISNVAAVAAICDPANNYRNVEPSPEREEVPQWLSSPTS